MKQLDEEYSDKELIKTTIKKESVFSDIIDIIEPTKKGDGFSDIVNINDTIKKGRPRKIINGDLIAESVRKAIPLREIARMCNCSRDTIYVRYGEFVKKGRELANQDWREEFNRRLSL